MSASSTACDAPTFAVVNAVAAPIGVEVGVGLQLVRTRYQPPDALEKSLRRRDGLSVENADEPVPPTFEIMLAALFSGQVAGLHVLAHSISLDQQTGESRWITRHRQPEVASVLPAAATHHAHLKERDGESCLNDATTHDAFQRTLRSGIRIPRSPHDTSQTEASVRG